MVGKAPFRQIFFGREGFIRNFIVNLVLLIGLCQNRVI